MSKIIFTFKIGKVKVRKQSAPLARKHSVKKGKGSYSRKKKNDKNS